ncbi:hypothetical protein ScalyP_jg10147 [Parmales sp. scaly parma]|nr:hypothetical protein ScalyP_jg10147 [Parmales sp. scaly parma]
MRVKELIQEARDGVVEQEDESATIKEELETEYYTTRNRNRKRILQKKRTTKSSKESRITRSRSRSSS